MKPRLRLLVLSLALSMFAGGATALAQEPPEPSAVTAPPGAWMTVGAIMVESRVSGVHRLKPLGFRSSSPSMLLSMKPHPSTTWPLPSPLVMVAAAALPRASITEIWVVPRLAGLWALSAARCSPSA